MKKKGESSVNVEPPGRGIKLKKIKNGQNESLN